MTYYKCKLMSEYLIYESNFEYVSSPKYHMYQNIHIRTSIPNIGHGLETLEIVYYLLDCFDHGESHIYTIRSMLWSWDGKTRNAVVAVAKYFDSHALVFLNRECAHIILSKYSLNLDSSAHRNAWILSFQKHIIRRLTEDITYIWESTSRYG